ncbi:EAL domain-containing protein [Maridesulfovibrio sp.]|uniref:bifunctional diguanylate cyclase/phosphodiesterase n=1 Tax=Maridesulfovibrio sp. TaxID=2795000 RepID=UPI003B00C6A5
MSDDKFIFMEEENNDGSPEQKSMNPWKILIVDDEVDVHESTVFSLQDSIILDRPLEFLHAYSGAEAVEVLREHGDVALVLLDAVMETEDAGLQAARSIREELGMEDIRIILRTGQPGQVPELETITRYDINDYKTKSELTRTKLLTAFIGALRSWQQIKRINNSRRGLEKIVHASNQFLADQGLQGFAEGVITQMAGLFDVEPDGIVCAASCEGDSGKPEEYKVIAAAGKYSPFINKTVHEQSDPDIFKTIRETLKRQESLVEENSITVYFSDSYKRNFATWIKSSRPLSEVDKELLEIFCTNISLCASNIELVKQLKRQAWEDPVLRIPNMAGLLKNMKKCLEGGTAQGMELALLDIDGFNQINELLGHGYGDSILKSLAGRLRTELGEKAYVARVAADVFAVLAEKETFSAQVLQRLTSMSTNSPNGELELSISIGIAGLDPENGVARAQIRKGFTALKKAKSEGSGQSIRYTGSIGAETRKHVQILHELRSAHAENQLSLVFQPQISLENKKAFCCETLLRWQKPNGDFVYPDQFIPLAEQSGLIVPIGEWVLETALNGLKEIHAAGFPEMTMAVNVSAVQFRHRNFLSMLDGVLARTGIGPDKLELEITESISAMGIEDILKILNGIRSRGISIAVDDFGTGYSSLSSLDKWPVDRLKIDRSFVNNMEEQSEGARLVDLVIPLGKQLGMKVLAEGVETEEQLHHLKELGCDEAQGYLISRPVPLDELITWLKAES